MSTKTEVTYTVIIFYVMIKRNFSIRKKKGNISVELQE